MRLMDGPAKRVGKALRLMRTVRFTPTASAELLQAQDWYENELPGLGQRFLESVTSAVERIADNPQQFPVIYKNIHRALLRRFPYALFFVKEIDDSLTVLACFHGSRDPVHWQRPM